jgi:hypothetical protein
VGLADLMVAWSRSDHPARKAGSLGGAYNGFKSLRCSPCSMEWIVGSSMWKPVFKKSADTKNSVPSDSISFQKNRPNSVKFDKNRPKSI